MPPKDIRIFFTLFFSLFATITGVGIVVPLLPVYAYQLGANGIYISLIFTSFSISRTVMLPYFGKLSDKKGRKPFITLGLFLYSIVSIAFLLCTEISFLIIVRFFQGIASAMIMPVAQAYIGEITPKGKEGFYMGMFNMSMFASMSFGPLMGGLINDLFNIQTAFICMAVFSFIGFLLSYYLLPPVSSEMIQYRNKESSQWIILLKNRHIVGLFIYRWLYTTCIGIIWTFLPIYAHKEFNLNSSAIGLLLMIGVLTNGVLQPVMGFLSDRINRRHLIILGGLLTLLSMYLMGFSHGFWELFLSSILFGFSGSLAMPPIMALATIYGKEFKSMGAVMSLLTMSHSFGMLTGSILGGVVMEMFTLQIAFPFGAIIIGIGVLLFLILTQELKAGQ
ncbi:MAG: MFS transporter [Desulfobacterales bacterium]|nr:MFS transporter [Desulfobacterales bacterium]